MEATGQSVVLTAPLPTTVPETVSEIVSSPAAAPVVAPVQKAEEIPPAPSSTAEASLPQKPVDIERAIVASDYFLENCKKIVKYALFKSGTLYLNSLLVILPISEDIEDESLD